MAVDTSYLTTQVNNIVTQLHGIFDDIGIPNHERESREAEVCLASSWCIEDCADKYSSSALCHQP